jgi:hypothetical protein
MTTNQQSDARTAEKTQADSVMSTLRLTQVATLWHPIMLTQASGEITEAKAAELLGLSRLEYRAEKRKIVEAVQKLVTQLASPLSLLLDDMKDQQKS